MLELIKRVIGKGAGSRQDEGGGDEQAHIALCVLLLEAAHVDGECSAEEKRHVISTLVAECGIERKEIEDLIAAGAAQRNDAVDLFRFTRFMNNNFTKEEKIGVMEAVWRIIHIDGRLEAHEDQFAHKLANLLRLTHKELIDAKIRARQQLNR